MAFYVAGESPAALIERADRGLYLAKEAGRDCVRMAPAHALAVTANDGVNVDV